MWWVIKSVSVPMGGDLAPSLGGRGKKFRGPNFRMTFLQEKVSINFNAENFWWPFFSHRQYFVCFFACLCCLKSDINIHDPFVDEKPLLQNKKILHQTFFSQFILCHAWNNTTSRSIGGRMHGPSSTPNILGDRPPVSPKFLPVSVPACKCLHRNFSFIWVIVPAVARLLVYLHLLHNTKPPKSACGV